MVDFVPGLGPCDWLSCAGSTTLGALQLRQWILRVQGSHWFCSHACAAPVPAHLSSLHCLCSRALVSTCCAMVSSHADCVLVVHVFAVLQGAHRLLLKTTNIKMGVRLGLLKQDHSRALVFEVDSGKMKGEQ